MTSVEEVTSTRAHMSDVSANLDLSDTLVGLKSKPQWNGQSVEIIGTKQKGGMCRIAVCGTVNKAVRCVVLPSKLVALSKWMTLHCASDLLAIKQLEKLLKRKLVHEMWAKMSEVEFVHSAVELWADELHGDELRLKRAVSAGTVLMLERPLWREVDVMAVSKRAIVAKHKALGSVQMRYFDKVLVGNSKKAADWCHFMSVGKLADASKDKEANRIWAVFLTNFINSGVYAVAPKMNHGIPSTVAILRLGDSDSRVAVIADRDLDAGVELCYSYRPIFMTSKLDHFMEQGICDFIHGFLDFGISKEECVANYDKMSTGRWLQYVHSPEFADARPKVKGVSPLYPDVSRFFELYCRSGWLRDEEQMKAFIETFDMSKVTVETVLRVISDLHNDGFHKFLCGKSAVPKWVGAEFVEFLDRRRARCSTRTGAAVCSG